MREKSGLGRAPAYDPLLRIEWILDGRFYPKFQKGGNHGQAENTNADQKAMSTNRLAILAAAAFWWFFIRRPAAELGEWSEQTDVALVFDGDMKDGNTGNTWPPA